MKRCAGAISLLVLMVCVGISGAAVDPRLQEADLAWDRGDYPTALRGYLALLPNASEQVSDAIAAQTGELYRTVELTPDGGVPRFSPDGRYLAYEAGRGVTRQVRIAAADAPARPVAVLTGSGATFSPDGKSVAYLKLAASSEMRDLENTAETADAAERARLNARLAALAETAARITIRDIASGAEREVDTGSLRKTAIRLAAGSTVVFAGSDGSGVDQVYLLQEGRPAAPITTGEPAKVLQDVNAPGTAVLFTHRAQGRRGGGPGGNTAPRFGVIALPAGTATLVNGSAPVFSRDGNTFAFVARADPNMMLMTGAIATPDRAVAMRTGPDRIEAPALSPDGSAAAFQMMTDQDWEVFTVKSDGSGEQRVTREIQHDVLPRFLTPTRLLAVIGEPRHRRSHVYDLASGTRTRLFHNNTIRTIAPEYEWVASPDGTKVLIVAERDGDTVSPERGVYLIDLATKVTRQELRARLERNLEAEEALRARGKRLFTPIAAAVANTVAEASVSRVFAYEKALFDFDSKHITRPGNTLASAYLFDAYKSFGYQPELQWFPRQEAAGGQTANVIATLKGTVNPELVYVVSSHYDSVAIGPGADDDSSGTAALLEAARILSKHPQPATIVFASFTGEEAGLLGSREFVRRAVADKIRIVGALNNDMVGWANDHRLDNTIRYSNPGIRDIQHAAAMQFSNLITYDALYYKNTDAHAYYEAYGDIVGGIGSYPVLGSPHYHQSHDTLETINHQLVTEVAKTTAATLMLMASSPSRLKDLKIDSYDNGTASISWTASPENGISGYIVAWGPADAPGTQQIRVGKPAASIRVARGATISVKAVNQSGLEGWDWARVMVP